MIVAPYPVSANRYWRRFGESMVVSAEARTYKRLVGLLWLEKRYPLRAGPVHVEIGLAPKLTVKGVASKTRIDLDNCIKVALDALNGVAYKDDSQVVSVRATVIAAVSGGALELDVKDA